MVLTLTLSITPTIVLLLLNSLEACFPRTYDSVKDLRGVPVVKPNFVSYAGEEDFHLKLLSYYQATRNTAWSFDVPEIFLWLVVSDCCPKSLAESPEENWCANCQVPLPEAAHDSASGINVDVTCLEV